MTNVDVAVVGAGVVGCAVARELAGQGVSVALLDARADVGDATSKANTAILHTGFDAVPGSLESALVARGYHLLGAYAEACGIAVERCGAVLVAWDEEELAALPSLRDKAERNGYRDCELLDADEVRAQLPHLGPGLLGGLAVPGEAIIDPWSVTLAYAQEALARGAALLLRTRVEGIEVGDDAAILHVVREGRSEQVHARWVVNAAGMGADVLDRMLGFDRFTVTPRRGELLVYDKQARPLVDRIVLPVPSKRGKGVLVSPTAFGNVMLGPTAVDIDDRADTSVTEEGVDFLLEKGARILPALLDEDVTAMYTGLRAATEHSDYVVELDAPRRYLLLGGIRSTGLTASMALAEHAAALLAGAGLALAPRDDLPSPPLMPPVGESLLRPYANAELIDSDPDYGRIVCFCERVTRGEVRDALASPIPPADLDGLRRRTRAQMGRCQGFYCGAEVAAMLEAGS